MRRSRRQRAKRRRVWRLTLTGSLLLFIGFLAFLFTRIHPDAPEKNKSDRVQFTPSHSEVKDEKSVARIMINGDFLYHDVLYWSAEIGNGYDFSKNFAYVKDFIAESDLAIGDFEGTIMPGRELCGYPLFNAPKEVAEAIVDAGYQVIALANNHILDMGLAGLQSTAEIFSEYGADVIGVYPDGNRNKENILIKNINGIQIALLNYAYGFNGMEQNLTVSEYEQYMSDLDEERMREEILYAEDHADITLIMPHMGIEYQLEPSDEQRNLYHQMIEWGADIIIGGHPHVAQPSETVEHNGEKKFILYSMGNFISNQREETLGNVWTERGVLMDITIEKDTNQTFIREVHGHPTWVNRVANGLYKGQYPLYDYTVYIIEDWLEGGKYANQLSPELRPRLQQAYNEVNDLLDIDF